MLRVLVTSDGSRNTLHAIRHVLHEYDQNHALDIHLLNVQPPFSALICEHSSKIARTDFHQEQADAALAPARRVLDDAGVPYTAHSKVGDTVDCIVDMAAELHCDGIVMGMRGVGLVIGPVSLGSVSSRVVHASGLPVTLVK